jgi:hypothetical protein
MLAVRTAIFACLVLAACDGNPFLGTPPTSEGGGTTGNPSVSTLPGTTDPTTTGSITRFEEHGKGPNSSSNGDGTASGTGSAPDVLGNGFAFRDGKIRYNAEDDTFAVDNLAFDGGNVYTRSPAFQTSLAGPDVGPAKFYEGPATVRDNQTGELIDQFSYRALYGESTSGQSHFAIVRTGAYVPYGFGGFIYNRVGGVGLPELEPGSNQAIYKGAYAGLRDFDGQSGLQVTSGEMTMQIDYNDFNPEESGLDMASGVTGFVDNRKVFDLNGNDITAQVIAEINADKSLTLTALPSINLFTGPGFMDANGETEGYVDNFLDGKEFEAGKYYAVLSGSKADEVVGIIVVNSKIGTYTARETGGFILYRNFP